MRVCQGVFLIIGSTLFALKDWVFGGFDGYLLPETIGELPSWAEAPVEQY